MFNKYVKTFQYGNQTVTLETGEIARQAAAAVKVSMGDTVVFVAVTTNKEVKEGQDFFPLPSIIWNALMPQAKSPAASSNAKANKAKKKS